MIRTADDLVASSRSRNNKDQSSSDLSLNPKRADSLSDAPKRFAPASWSSRSPLEDHATEYSRLLRSTLCVYLLTLFNAPLGFIAAFTSSVDQVAWDIIILLCSSTYCILAFIVNVIFLRGALRRSSSAGGQQLAKA